MAPAPSGPDTTAVIRRGPNSSSCIFQSAPATESLPSRFGAPHQPQPHEEIGAYRIIREVGVGGMGVVYEAYDQRLKRPAAIKMIRHGGASTDALRRFQTEAEAVAQVQHPNIVQIYEVGWQDNQPYVALEFLSGGSLYAKAANKPQPPAEAASLVRVLAMALDHAHNCGVIHRDLKPANVLFTADGTPKITDFGAARLEQVDLHASALTRVGEVIGTPQYMAPEQARGSPDAVTPAVDVYALGAVLYHLLTGRPPHDGPDPFDVLTAVVQTDPVPPRRLLPKIPRDLETICLKALAKHPAERYRSAAAMAADLERYLAGESILAKPDAPLVRLWKRAKRKPAIAGLAVGLVLVALAGLSGVAWQWSNALRARDAAMANATIAQQALASAQTSEMIAQAKSEEAKLAAERANAESIRKEQALFRSRVSEISLMIASGDLPKAQNLLEQSRIVPAGLADPRHWEWHHLNRLSRNCIWMTDLLTRDSDRIWIHAFARSPDGKFLAVSGGNPYVGHEFDRYVPAQMAFIEVATGNVVRRWTDYIPQAAMQLVWRDANTLVAATSERGIFVLDYPSGQTRHAWLAPDQAAGHLSKASILSPDGRHAARCLTQFTLEVVDTESGESLRRMEFSDPIDYIPQTTQAGRKWLFIFSGGPNTYVIDPLQGTVRLKIPKLKLFNAAIDPASRLFAAHFVPLDQRCTLLDCWDLNRGQRLWSIERPRLYDTSRLEFNPDGDKIAEVHNNGSFIYLHDVGTGRLDCELRGHSNRILDFCFSPDGRHIASASNDGSIRLWSTKGYSEVARHRAHSTGARKIAFDSCGCRLYSGGMDSVVIAWDLTRERPDGTLLPPLAGSGKSYGGAFAGGLWIGPDGLARFLDTSIGQLLTFDPATYTTQSVISLDGLSYRSEKTATDFDMSADARFLLGTGTDKRPRLWVAATGRAVHTLPGPRPEARLIAAALSRDGTTAAGTAIDLRDKNAIHRELFVWDTATGSIRHREVLEGYSYTALTFDPTGTTLIAGVATLHSQEAGLHYLNLESGQKTKHMTSESTMIRHLAVSPNGKQIAMIDHFARVDGPVLRVVDWHNPDSGWHYRNAGPATGITFSPDGRRIALARFDDTLVLLDAVTGIEVLYKAAPSTRQGDYAFPARAAFSPDGRSLVMNHSNSLVSVWRTDRWDCTEAERRFDRQREADQAAYAFHLRAAIALKDQPTRAGFRFHRQRLEMLDPPNPYLQAEWLKVRAEADAIMSRKPAP